MRGLSARRWMAGAYIRRGRSSATYPPPQKQKARFSGLMLLRSDQRPEDSGMLFHGRLRRKEFVRFA